jgi:CMP-N-acetylneuraminic acid synthetase
MEQMTKRILSIIPARSGSKGLSQKNIINLAGKPLMAWTIEASLNSKYISKTIVSSDSDEVLTIAQKYNSDVLKRPNEFATDFSSSEIVVKNVLESIEEKFEYLVLLQPTSPLRDSNDIDNAFEKLFSSKATALISVRVYDNKILKAFKENDLGFIEGISNNQYPFMRRQELPKTYLSNGAIYIIKVEEFLKNFSFFSDKTISFVMDDRKSTDLDSKEDLEQVKLEIG